MTVEMRRRAIIELSFELDRDASGGPVGSQLLVSTAEAQALCNIDLRHPRIVDGDRHRPVGEVPECGDDAIDRLGL
jgi:hypothetical protein